MLPPPARETTTLSRIVAAIVFAFAFPALMLSQAIIWTDDASAFAQRAATAASAVFAALPFGAVLGWPYVFCAGCAWACLHQFGHHHRSLAVLVGAATGVAVAVKLNGLDGPEAGLLWPLSAVLGLLTGLGVWQIAYGRRKRPASSREASLA
jgi:cation transport ATPase